MCGFVCLWNCGDEALARSMIGRIAHRGPDATEVCRFEDAPLVMAHCRLSIIGGEDGRQPLLRRPRALVANGEIFNHADLRAMLGPEAFRTHSDSETILHLASAPSARWITRLEGMFAFVLVEDGRVIAARDPLGIKPLYGARLGEGLAFASELKAFDGLGARDVAPVPPGALIDSARGTRRWFRMPQGCAEAEPGLDEAQVARELRLVLEDAVERWLVADVEVGAFLSGGLDSSIIAALAIRARGGRLRTFAVGAPGSPDLAAARRVAAHIGSEHHEHVFDADDVARVLGHVVYHLESADADLVRSAVPTHFAAALARRHVKAVLTGEGADELFAGYAYHAAYLDRPRALADELTRALGTMHNVNLQRVDRITMAESLEARTPFLDRDLIAFAQSIPATLKLRRDPAGGPPVEKWILRRACEDLLPADLVWRKKAQFDEGSGALAALDAALPGLMARHGAASEGALYEALLRARFAEPDMILANAGAWAADRVAV